MNLLSPFLLYSKIIRSFPFPTIFKVWAVAADFPYLHLRSHQKPFIYRLSAISSFLMLRRSQNLAVALCCTINGLQHCIQSFLLSAGWFNNWQGCTDWGDWRQWAESTSFSALECESNVDMWPAPSFFIASVTSVYKTHSYLAWLSASLPHSLPP